MGVSRLFSLPCQRHGPVSRLHNRTLVPAPRCPTHTLPLSPLFTVGEALQCVVSVRVPLRELVPVWDRPIPKTALDPGQLTRPFGRHKGREMGGPSVAARRTFGYSRGQSIGKLVRVPSQFLHLRGPDFSLGVMRHNPPISGTRIHLFREYLTMRPAVCLTFGEWASQIQDLYRICKQERISTFLPQLTAFEPELAVMSLQTPVSPTNPPGSMR